MSARARALVLLVFGAALLRLAGGPALSNYVRPATKPLVVTAGAVAAVLALTVLLRRPDVDKQAGTSGSRAAGLLVAPVLAVALIAPPPLGALTAQRPPTAPPRPGGGFPVLPATGPVHLALAELVQRSVWGADSTLAGRQLLVTGFVSRSLPTGFVLSRLVITCCAADARPLDVQVTDPPGPHLSAARPTARTTDRAAVGGHAGDPVVGEWVQVEGTYAGPGPAGPLVPLLRADAMRPVPRPADPYG